MHAESLPATRLPGPRALPFLGPAGSLMRFYRDPIRCMLDLHATHGAIAAVSAGDPSLVCAFGPELNQQVLSEPDLWRNAAELPIRIREGTAIQRLTHFLVGMNGPAHQKLRRAMTPLFQKSYLEHHRDNMVAAAEGALAKWQPGTEIDLSEAMAELALCVGFRCLFGLDVTDESRSLARMALGFTTGATAPANIALPWDVPGLPYGRFMRTCERLEARLLALLEERRADAGARNDALSVLLSVRGEDGTPLPDSLLVGLANEMFIAGHDTTARTLGWTLFLLERHPKIRADLLDELDAELHGAAPTLEQVARLPLLDAVLKESQRLLPATPFLFFRRNDEAVQLGPYALPPGSGVVISPLVTHHLPDLFPAPNHFRPERWSGPAPSGYAYLPFGAGPRICLGVSFANLSLRVMLALVLQRFRLTSPPGADVSFQARGVILGSKAGIRMRVDAQDRACPAPNPVLGNIHELVALA